MRGYEMGGHSPLRGVVRRVQMGRRARRQSRESNDRDGAEADGASRGREGWRHPRGRVLMRARFVLPAVGATLVTMGLFAPPGAHAQEAPPSNPPDLGLPPATARPAKGEAPAVTARPAGVSSPGSRKPDDESFGSAVVGTFTDPGRLVGALMLALGLGLAVG